MTPISRFSKSKTMFEVRAWVWVYHLREQCIVLFLNLHHANTRWILYQHLRMVISQSIYLLDIFCELNYRAQMDTEAFANTPWPKVALDGRHDLPYLELSRIAWIVPRSLWFLYSAFLTDLRHSSSPGTSHSRCNTSLQPWLLKPLKYNLAKPENLSLKAIPMRSTSSCQSQLVKPVQGAL